MNKPVKLLSFFLMVALSVLCAADSVFAQTSPAQASDERLDFANGLYNRNMYEMAIVEYEKLIEQQPDHPAREDILFRLGESHFFLKKYVEAEGLYQQFLEKFPAGSQSETAKLRLGESAYHQSKKDQARTFLEPLTQSASVSIRNTALFYLGKLLYENGDYTRAYQELLAIQTPSEENPYWEMANYYLGDIKARENRFEEAAVFFRQMYNSDKADLKQIAAFNLGKCAFQQKNYTAAAPLFLEAHQNGPHPQLSDDAYINYLNTLFLSGSFEELLSKYDAGAIESDAKKLSAKILAANALLQTENYQDGAGLFNQILDGGGLEPRDKESAELGLLEALLKLEKYDTAAEARAGMNPERAFFKERWNYLSAEILKRSGRTESALDFYNKLAADSRDADYIKQALLGQAYLLLEEGKLTEAYDALSAYLKDYPTSPEAVKCAHDKILIQIKLKNWPQAIADSAAFLKRYPEDEHALSVERRLASLHLQVEDYEKAFTIYQSILDQRAPAPEDRGEILFYMAYARQLAGRLEEASEIYQQLDPAVLKPDLKAAAFKNKAYIFIQQDKLPEAAGTYSEFLASFPDQALDEQIYLWLYDYYLTEENGKALLDVLDHAARTLKAETPGDGRLDFYRGEALRLQSQFEESLAYYDRNIQTENAFALKSRFGKGLSLESLNRLDEAKSVFETVLTSAGEEHAVAIRARMQIAEILSAMNLPEEAAKAYLATAILYDEESYVPQALWYAGNEFTRAGRTREARKAYEELIERYPANPRSEEARLALEAFA